MSAPALHQIELRLRELAQLFNSMDPSPFSDRDLDDAAEEFIVGWVRELPHQGELELVVHLAVRPEPDRVAGVQAAVQRYFADRAEMKKRELRLMMRRGRGSMVVGLLFLGACFGAVEMMEEDSIRSWSEFVKLGLQIVGWVAMWRPLEIFLYDWWPIRSDRLLMERLARMQVRLDVAAK